MQKRCFLSTTLVYMNVFQRLAGGVRSQRSHDYVHVFSSPGSGKRTVFWLWFWGLSGKSCLNFLFQKIGMARQSELELVSFVWVTSSRKDKKNAGIHSIMGK